MSTLPRRITARLSALLCATLMASSLAVATAPPAKGVALVFVLFMLNGQPHVMRSDGSQSRPVGSEVEAASRDHHLAIYAAEAAINEVMWRFNAPEGSRIVWHNPLVTGPSGRLVTGGPGNDGFPALPASIDPMVPSPFAFVSDRDGDNEIYTINVDGTGLLQLTDNDADDTEPSWGPDGKLVFTSDRGGDPDIWTMDSDGSDQLKIAFNSDSADTQPEWSPDGETIVITSERSGNKDIWLLHLDLSSPTQLTDGFTEESDPVWSPEGDAIFFTGGGDGDLDVYAMTPEGQVTAKLTNNDGADRAMDATFIPPPHTRRMSIAIDGRGVVTGRLRDDFGMPGCIRNQKVFLQRRTTRGWQPVAETKTGAEGRYRIAAKATTGDYRVHVRRTKPRVPLRDIVCTGVTRAAS